jgi:hypothetical protein
VAEPWPVRSDKYIKPDQGQLVHSQIDCGVGISESLSCPDSTRY